MKYIYSLKDKFISKVNISGGKGANLHRLIHHGFNVPEGFIVSTKAFNEFLNYNKLLPLIKKELSSIRVDNHESISRASKNIKKEIKGAEVPNAVLLQIDKSLLKSGSQKYAVRSSGVFEDSYDNSWAGLFDSFLEISKEDISENIKKCWASFFNSRAIVYNIRAYKNISKLNFAVVVQKMIASEKSGVAFSIEPKENDVNKILIEGAPGLGENHVSGKELAFTAIIDKKKRIVLSRYSSKKAKSDLLSTREINLLSGQIIKLEKLFKNPVDVEWAMASDKLYFLQIRPITALGRSPKLQNGPNSLPNINDYELTFKVSGLSFLFTDMLAHGFKYLHPLFTSDKDSQFLQYFTNDKMEYAAKYGMDMFSKPTGFKDYQNKFTKFYDNNVVLLDGIIANKKLSKSSTQQFFSILSKLFTYYSKNDNQFTNLAYVYAEENQVINKNLNLLSKFKDVARVWINNTSIDQNSQFSRFIDRLCNEFEIERSDLECYKTSEILQLFNGSHVPNQEIKNRKLSFTIFYNSREQVYITGKKSVNFIDKVSSRQKALSSSEIRGQVANKVQKVVQGKVRVINVDYGKLDQLNQDINAMIKGEILVAEFTAPELMSACRKAKAIVTDIGGLLSHAAIVSRELNIPCLVGTGNATKILKTGDAVTIDFESGSVKKNDVPS